VNALRGVVCVMLLCALAADARAEVDVHASLSRDTAAVGESVELTIAVSGAVGRVATPEIPPVDYLQVVSSGSQQNITFINGQMTSTSTYTFRLVASREGTYTIPGIEVRAAGQVFTTQPLTLTVTGRSSAPPPPQPGPFTSRPPAPDDTAPGEEPPTEDVFVELVVDDDRPWVGEQVTMSLRFYQSTAVRLMGSAEYSPPSTEGLVAEPLPDPPTTRVELGGLPYQLIERRTALFAPAPGEYTIGAASITLIRSYLSGEETITTDPVTLHVRPLPEAGRTDAFSGVVGRLHATLNATSEAVRVGDAVTVRLEVTGTGDIRQLEAPELQCGEARVYPSGRQPRVGPQTTGAGDVIGGSVVFEYLVMPAQAGELIVRPVEIQYFNPQTERYEMARTSPLSLQVLPGEGGETSLRSEGGEIRYLKENGLGMRSRAPITSSTWFWLMQLAPLAALGWALARRVELLRRAADPRYRRFTEAAAVARRQLPAIATAGDPRETYRLADATLAQYLAAKTNAAAASLSPDDARELLVRAGCSEELAGEARDTLAVLRAGVYAPGAYARLPADEVPARVRTLIDEIEAALR